MDEVWVANKRLKAADDSLLEQKNELNERERSLNDRLEDLERKKRESAESFGNPDAKDDDVLEINVGGEIVRAKRATLTQLKGTNFGLLFGGRWEKKLPKDRDGRIFLDIGPGPFRSIVDYLNALAISSEDDHPDFPAYEDGHQMKQYFKLFGIPDEHLPMGIQMPDSVIIKNVAQAKILRKWLSEDGSGEEFRLLFRSSRDGKMVKDFHSKCDDEGSTVTIIKTREGMIVGGYSNIPWKSSGGYKNASKAFVFCLSGGGGATPTKLRLKHNHGQSVEHRSDYGPIFGRSGNDTMIVHDGTRVQLRFKSNKAAYECSSKLDKPDGIFDVDELEVFQITKRRQDAESVTSKCQEIDPVLDIYGALKEKSAALREFDQKLAKLEEDFEMETQFINYFARFNQEDFIMLDVSGSTMATYRCTLRVIDESVLSRQFDDSMWTEQRNGCKSVDEWTPDDVQSWIKFVQGIPPSDEAFNKNRINGKQLLALGKEGLENLLGKNQIGAIYLLLGEIDKLKKSRDKVMIDHSPYCFGKILDFLRLKRLHSHGMVSNPSLPVVQESKKDLFQRIVQFYFPGESSKHILG